MEILERSVNRGCPSHCLCSNLRRVAKERVEHTATFNDGADMVISHRSHGSVMLASIIRITRSIRLPTRFGSISAELKYFIDSLGPYWLRGEIRDKVGAAFTSASGLITEGTS